MSSRISDRLRHEAEAIALSLDAEKSAKMAAGNQPAVIGNLGQRIETCRIGSFGIDIIDKTDTRIVRLQRAHMQHIAP
ncbi:hypothetical protein D3C87_1989630 [compost metagenome]